MGVPTLDSHYVFHYLYESGASWNKVNFSNSEVDAAIRVMEGEVDLDKRNAAIANAWKIVKDDISYLPLHHQVISWASKSGVNVPIRPNNEPLFRTASFKLKKLLQALYKYRGLVTLKSSQIDKIFF